MNMKDIRAMATDLGIKAGKLGKVDLVRAIQLKEGNFDCFGRAGQGYCDQGACTWRDDCLRVSGQPC